jgi:hypothetical protein
VIDTVTVGLLIPDLLFVAAGFDLKYKSTEVK